MHHNTLCHTQKRDAAFVSLSAPSFFLFFKMLSWRLPLSHFFCLLCPTDPFIHQLSLYTISPSSPLSHTHTLFIQSQLFIVHNHFGSRQWALRLCGIGLRRSASNLTWSTLYRMVLESREQTSNRKFDSTFNLYSTGSSDPFMDTIMRHTETLDIRRLRCCWWLLSIAVASSVQTW